MKVILKNNTSYYEIEKSKFLGFSFYVASKQECIEIIEKLKQEYSDARHVCYAYVLNKDQSIQKYSDDKEPSGTAGMPMLSLLLKENLTNILVVVVRYFGGIKLGAGGLLRSYVKATSLLFENQVLEDYSEIYKYKIYFNYEQTKNVNYWVNTNNLQILDKEYTDVIEWTIQAKEELNPPNFIINMIKV